jgi:endoglucanase
MLAVLGVQSVLGQTPAHVAALKLMRGANFGNDLEYLPGDPASGVTYANSDFKLARAEGFDHVRLPVGWSLYSGSGPDFTISPDFFAQVDSMVGMATNNGLSIIVDMHHFDSFMGNPNGNANQFYSIWRQVASHYATAPASVVFELLNEPNSSATTTVMNGIYAEAIREIRAIDPNRTLIVGPGNYYAASELSKMVLPASDKNLIVTIHCYDPYYFTHQGAEWAYPDTKTTNVVFPGPPPTPLKPDPSITHDWVITWFNQYNHYATSTNPSSPAAFTPVLTQAKTWADTHGRPMHVGEFGCYYKAASSYRVGFYQSIREAMDSMGLGWSMWDWKAGFHYVVNGLPSPSGMRAAMFPQPSVTASGVGSFTLNSAMGKTFVIQRATSLAPPISWQTISTQTLTSPTLSFTDVQLNPTQGFYQVEWLK